MSMKSAVTDLVDALADDELEEIERTCAEENESRRKVKLGKLRARQ